MLILNGDDKKLKALAAPVFRKELLENSLYENSKETVDVLINKYGKVQVNPREINLFAIGTDERIDGFHGCRVVVELDSSASIDMIHP